MDGKIAVSRRLSHPSSLIPLLAIPSLHAIATQRTISTRAVQDVKTRYWQQPHRTPVSLHSQQAHLTKKCCYVSRTTQQAFAKHHLMISEKENAEISIHRKDWHLSRGI